MADWSGRADTNEKLMAPQTSMIFYTMHLNYPQLFAQLKRHYPQDTPVAVVNYAGDRERQKVIASTVGRFLNEVKYQELPEEEHMLLVGKFLKVGQARKKGLAGSKYIEERHGVSHGEKK
jgi:precorrin-4 methylase